MHLTFAQVADIIGRARARADAIRVPMNIAVLDAGGHLKAFARMDGAVLGSIDVAIGKARTAVLFAMNSEKVWEFCKPGGGSPALEHTNGGLVPFAGGIPITDAEGEVIGAVGVSGGLVVQDSDVAQAAIGSHNN